MLLFADGFETFNFKDLWRKWGFCTWFASQGNIPPVIVHGPDTTFSPAKLYATRADGRAIQVRQCTLTALVKPSRTLFMGFAFRKASSGGSVIIRVLFYKSVIYNKADIASQNEYGGTPWDASPPPGGVLIATCNLSIAASYIDITWTFVGTNPLTKIGRIDTSANLHSGDWRYLQVGMTLMGNVVAQPQAWAEVRLGSRGGANNLVHSNIMTAAESGGNASFLMNAVRLTPGGTYYEIGGAASIGLDDVYICNDEGEFNNTFLGNVKVRRVSVSGDGSENHSVPFADTYRFRTVDEDFIDTVNPLPSPLPDPETTPLFIPWEPLAGDYLTIEEYGDRQLMRYNSLNLTGTYSKIHGAILHALMQPQYPDTLGGLIAVRKIGTEALIESKPMDAPLAKRTEFEARHFVWENEETIAPGEQYARWASAVVDGSEWGFELTPVTIDPVTYDPAIARINIVIYDTLAETLGFAEMVHRYIEEFVTDTLVSTDDPIYQYVWAFYETLGFDESSEGNRGGNRFLNEVLEFAEYVPYTIMFAGEFIGFAEDVFIQFIDLIDETLDAADWADGFWEELFTDTFDIGDLTDAAFLLYLEDTFGLEEPFLWDNHELIEDGFAIDADEPWDNHELIEEYLHSDADAVQGVGLIAEDGFGIAEDHHDGWWVELFTDYTLFADYVYTQHWRYETMFGMVVNSWQVAPIEQTGNDGDHTGNNPWGS